MTKRRHDIRVGLATWLAAGALVSSAFAQETDRLTITDYPERERLVIALGPIDLPSNTSHHDLQQMPVQVGIVPFDLMIHTYWIEAIDGQGRPVPQTVVHHANIHEPDRRELFLPIMHRLIAASHETKPVKFPGWLFGIPMRGGERFLALTMLHNPTDVSYEDVSVRFVIEYDRRRPEDLLPLYTVYTWHMDAGFPLGSKAFDLPPGTFVKSWEGSPAVRVGIAGMGGHVHRYATRLRLEDVTTGEVIYDVKPVAGDDGHIDDVPQLPYAGRGIGWPLYPDHVYRVSVTYFNPTGDTIPDGGMGSVAGGVIIDPNEVWPAADPTNPLFAADYDSVLASTSMGGHSGGGAEEAGHDHGASAPPPATDANASAAAGVVAKAATSSPATKPAHEHMGGGVGHEHMNAGHEPMQGAHQHMGAGHEHAAGDPGQVEGAEATEDPQPHQHGAPAADPASATDPGH